MKWAGLILPEQISRPISRAVYGRYAELEAQAKSFSDYIKDNSKTGLEGQGDIVSKIATEAENLLMQVQNFRKIKEPKSRTAFFSSMKNSVKEISEDLEVLEQTTPAINGSKTFQPSTYKVLFEGFLNEYEKRKRNLLDDSNPNVAFHEMSI